MVQPSYTVASLQRAGVAGVVCAIVAAALNGFDVAKIRLQNQISSSREYGGMISTIRKIYSEEGAAGLAKGVNASMLREVTYSSIRIGAYEPIRLLLSRSSRPEECSPVTKFFAALISGGVGAGEILGYVARTLHDALPQLD